jgi:hypothetical protein
MVHRGALMARRRVHASRDDVEPIVERQTLSGERRGANRDLERNAHVELAGGRQNTTAPLRPGPPLREGSRGFRPTTLPTTWGAN